MLWAKQTKARACHLLSDTLQLKVCRIEMLRSCQPSNCSCLALLSAFQPPLFVFQVHRMCQNFFFLLLPFFVFWNAAPEFSFLLCSLATLPTCLGSCWRLVWFALLYADVLTLLQRRWNNSCSPLPFLPLRPAFIHLSSPIASDQLYLLNMTTGPLRGRPGPFTLHAKESVDSWWATTAAKGETASSLSSCYRWMAVLTDRRNKLARGIKDRQAYISGLLLFFSPLLFDIRCIFIQIQREHERDRWPGAHVLLRWFNAKQSICVYRFPVYTKAHLLHNWAVVCGRRICRKGETAWHKIGCSEKAANV